MTTSQPEPRVGNEDREAAIKAAALGIAQGAEDEMKYFYDDAVDAVAALISHGWGPRPTVSTEELAMIVTRLIATFAMTGGIEGSGGYMALEGYLRECGIEVTDDHA